MANGERKRGIGSRLFGLINPIRDPSLLVAIILTVIEKGSSNAKPVEWAIFGLLNWIAVKGAIWLLVNFAFSFVYLTRKALWAARHPRLAWRLLDAMGTEEIIIGGLRPDMFTGEDGSLHEGQLAYAGVGLAGGYGGGYPQGALGSGYRQDDDYSDYQGYGREPVPSMRLDDRSEELRDLLANYSRLLDDWMSFTEEKWRAVSDSQLGWKPLRGRWNGWEQIYSDAFSPAPNTPDNTARRFDNSQTKGSAASAVACFLRDLDMLRQGMSIVETGEQPQSPRAGGFGGGQPQVSSRTGKAPIIRNPMIVDAD
ncbi:MAG TPA: hypothetical protein VFN11_20885 [Ktedonobacterales bacterium]|nr:hypothetical protein [Ktedonobacterales bacterium]